MERTRERELAWQIEEFMICCKSKHLRRKTMMSYEQSLRLFERWCKKTLDVCYINEIGENVIFSLLSILSSYGIRFIDKMFIVARTLIVYGALAIRAVGFIYFYQRKRIRIFSCNDNKFEDFGSPLRTIVRRLPDCRLCGVNA